MSIAEIYEAAKEPVVSFEFLPPKTDAGYRTLFRTIKELKQLAPGFVSVTMGAGGSTRSKTVDLTIEIRAGVDDIKTSDGAFDCQANHRPFVVGEFLLEVGDVIITGNEIAHIVAPGSFRLRPLEHDRW